MFKKLFKTLNVLNDVKTFLESMDKHLNELNNNVKDINKKLANYKLIDNGTIFDLGNMHVEVIPMEGHTKGSIGLLIKEHKLLI